jgi:hypothetical protein
VEPWHVKPRVLPHVPSREMGSAVELGVTDDETADDDDAMVEDDTAGVELAPMGPTALQSPKSS